MPKLRLALVTALLFSASLAFFAPPAAAEQTTLSVRTEDGLVVMHGELSLLEQAQSKMRGELPAGATNGDLLAFINKNWPAGAIRMEVYTPATAAGAGKGEENVTLETTVASAVAEGRIPNIIGKELYEAYMLFRMRGDTMMLLHAPPAGSPVVSRTVFIFSSAWGNGMNGIYIDGNNAFAQNPGAPPPNGYKFVVMDPTGSQVIGESEFNTFDDPSSGTRMQQFLAAQPANSILLGAIQWGPGVFLSGGAVTAMHGYGSKTAPDPQILSSHAMIGEKGLDPGKAVEESEINAGSEVMMFDNRLYIQEDKVKTLKTAQGSRIVVIAGTKPDDKVVILGRGF